MRFINIGWKKESGLNKNSNFLNREDFENWR